MRRAVYPGKCPPGRIGIDADHGHGARQGEAAIRAFKVDAAGAEHGNGGLPAAPSAHYKSMPIPVGTAAQPEGIATSIGKMAGQQGPGGFR